MFQSFFRSHDNSPHAHITNLHHLIPFPLLLTKPHHKTQSSSFDTAIPLLHPQSNAYSLHLPTISTIKSVSLLPCSQNRFQIRLPSSLFSFLQNKLNSHDQSLQDKAFDPSTIEDLMKLFEIESYKAWAAAELEQETELKETEHAMQEAEEHLDSVMESAMDEFTRFEQEMERISRDEVQSLVETGERARKMGNFMEKTAAIASNKYMEAALNSATSSFKSAWKGISSGKVHPFS